MAFKHKKVYFLDFLINMVHLTTKVDNSPLWRQLFPFDDADEKRTTEAKVDKNLSLQKKMTKCDSVTTL